MTQYQPQAKQRHTTRNILLIVLACALLALPAFWVFVWGYTAVRVAIADREHHEVVYKVTGSAKDPDIFFSSDGHGETGSESRATLPWASDTLTIKGRNQLLSVSVTPPLANREPTRCEIWVDGKLVEQDDPEKAFPGLGIGASCTYIP